MNVFITFTIMGTLSEKIYYGLLIFCIIIYPFVIWSNNEKKNIFISMSIYFVITYSVEKYGEYLVNTTGVNYWLFNYFTIFQIGFFLIVLRSTYKSRIAQKSVLIITTVVVVTSLINVLFLQGVKRFHSITYGLGSIVIVTCCIYYYLQLFKFPSINNLLKSVEFWIVTALLFYFVCGFPIFVLNNIYYKKVAIVLWPTIATISDINNIIFYTMMIFALLCKIDLTALKKIFNSFRKN